MIASRMLPLLLLTIAANVAAADWRPAWTPDWPDAGRGLFYAERTAACPTDARALTVHLAFFASPSYRLKVVDLGDGERPKYRTLAAAFRAEGCVAGVNGGFFHSDLSPLGLVVAETGRINEFEHTRLLSGVVYSDSKGTDIVRRARFRDHPGITALLQTGPYLVEAGRAVRGLSSAKSDRRTFIATDWRGHWAIGATPGLVTLAELADVLDSPGALTTWRVDRAINLDGGSSTGFFFDRGPDAPPVVLKPWKRVRNLVCVAKR